MPQPTVQQVHVNRPLSVISTAYMNDQDAYVFDKVFPRLLVEHKSDLYFIYQKDSFFRDEAQVRAPGAESAGSGYGITTSNYTAEVYAIHNDVPDQIADNADQPLQPLADASIFCTQKLLLKQEVLWAASYFKSGVWGTDFTPTNLWSDESASSPVEDVRTGIATILGSTGYMPNTLTLGFQTYNALLNHPDIVDRIKYGASPASPAVVTPQAMAAVFGLDRVLVAKAIETTANEGNATQTYSFILGKNALLTYSPDAPGLRRPSAGYSFYWRGISDGMGMPVKITDFYLPWLKATRVEGEVAMDLHLVGSDLGYMFNSVVA